MERYGLIDRFVKYYDEGEIEFPPDWDEIPMEIEARVGLANLEKYDEIIKCRIESAQKYFEYYKNNSQIRLPSNNQGVTFSHFVAIVENRGQCLKEYLKKGIQLGWLIEYNIPEMKAYGAHRPEEFPIAARYARTTINLPVWGGAKIAEAVIKNVMSKLS